GQVAPDGLGGDVQVVGEDDHVDAAVGAGPAEDLLLAFRGEHLAAPPSWVGFTFVYPRLCGKSRRGAPCRPRPRRDGGVARLLPATTKLTHRTSGAYPWRGIGCRTQHIRPAGRPTVVPRRCAPPETPPCQYSMPRCRAACTERTRAHAQRDPQPRRRRYGGRARPDRL